MDEKILEWRSCDLTKSRGGLPARLTDDDKGQARIWLLKLLKPRSSEMEKRKGGNLSPAVDINGWRRMIYITSKLMMLMIHITSKFVDFKEIFFRCLYIIYNIIILSSSQNLNS